MEASSRSWAIALHAQDCPAARFELPEIYKTCVTPRIATARRNAPGRVSQLQTSNCENHPLGIFSTVFGFQREKPSMPDDMPLTCAAKHCARLCDSAGSHRSEDPFMGKRARLLSC